MMRSGSTIDDLSFTQWFDLICQSLEYDQIKYKDEILPTFPDDDIQISTVGAAGITNLIPINIFYKDCVDHFQKKSNWASNDKQLLDFGCGWGRITRFFLRDFLSENIMGIDVEQSMLDICRSTFSNAQFRKCDPFPPTDIEPESVDFIVGYSVFSHLSENACHCWMEEFSRILKPGGMVSITTRGRPFFDYCMSLKNSEGSSYTNALANLFPDFNIAKSRYDAGEIVHSNAPGVSGGGEMNSQYYGETFIPEQYARKALSKHLEFVEFVFEPNKHEHPIMYFTKT